jgi:hypothetical protein
MTQANPSHPYTLASRSKSLPASQNLPKSMVAQTHGRKESTGIQHCIKAIAGEVVKLSSVHLINFGGGGQVIALKSATALILDRCAAYKKKPTHKQHIWSLPTQKPTLKKPKELFFANARPKIEQNTGNRKKRNRMNSIFRNTKPTEKIWS